MDAEREQFEKWAGENRIGAGYNTLSYTTAWEGWVARGGQIATKLRERVQEINDNFEAVSAVNELRALADEIGGKING